MFGRFWTLTEFANTRTPCTTGPLRASFTVRVTNLAPPFFLLARLTALPICLVLLPGMKNESYSIWPSISRGGARSAHGSFCISYVAGPGTPWSTAIGKSASHFTISFQVFVQRTWQHALISREHTVGGWPGGIGFGRVMDSFRRVNDKRLMIIGFHGGRFWIVINARWQIGGRCLDSFRRKMALLWTRLWPWCGPR
jgi:hypothetical protein